MVIDIAAMFYDRPVQADTRLVGIFTCSDPASTMPGLVALAIDNIPMRKQINDNQACALPRELSELAAYSLSCFSDTGYAIPVLNLNAIFSDKGLAMQAAGLISAKPVNAMQTGTNMENEADCNNTDITSLISPEDNSLNVN